MMRFLRLLISIVLTSSLLGACSLPEAQAPQASESDERRVVVPDFSLLNLEGETVRLSEFKGKRPVLLLFWATWCVYCRKEMPNVIALRNEIPRDQLEVLGVDLGESAELVKPYAEKLGVNFPVVLDQDGSVANSYGVQGVPTYIVVGRDGLGVIAENRLTPDFVEVLRDESRS